MPVSESAAHLYLDLLKKVLTYYLWGESSREVRGHTGFKRAVTIRIQRLLASRGLRLVRNVRFDPAERAEGRDWPPLALTMIGLKRLDNLQACIEDVIRREVPGDLIETGVWRGGAVIFMRAALKAYGVRDRLVWAADSFEGPPRPDPERYPADRNSELYAFELQNVSLDEVRDNFARYGLLDQQVRFLRGWFSQTLPHEPPGPLAIIRLDAVMYESTMDALTHLYPRLSPGGYVIVDDYGAAPEARAAVDDFRQQQGIAEPLQPIDWTGVFWQRAPVARLVQVAR